MTKEIRPFLYSGIIQAPSSKSYLQRAIAIASLADGTSTINGVTKSDDVEAAIAIAKSLGAQIVLNENQLKVTGISDRSIGTVSFNCGEAGLSTRMYSAIAASLSNDATVNGSGSILTRPMDMVIDAITQLGAKVNSNSDCLPLKIVGGISSGEIHIDGSESSQLLTGLLIALPGLDGDSIIYVNKLNSIPYIQMTLDILTEFGITIDHDRFKTFTIKGNQKPKALDYTVEGDWSGASFHVVGAAISGEIELKGLNSHSAQADLEILKVVELAGAKVSLDKNSIHISEGNLQSFEFDASQCPDLFPPIAALAACSEGVSRIIGTDRLIHKESNRALTIQSELKKLGVKVELGENVMEIAGTSVTGGSISSRGDHRIAMMGAILASVSSGAIHIENSEAVNKSYPGFYNDLP